MIVYLTAPLSVCYY